MYPFYLGIDLHLKRSYMALMKANGEPIDRRRLRNKEVAAYLQEKVPKKTYAVLEATRNWAWMYDLLSEHVERVELAHPKKVKLIAEATLKSDKIDATTLAHLARLNFLPTAHAAPPAVRDLRTLMRHRSWLVWQRTQAKNRIHGVLAGYNLVSPVGDLFGKLGRQFVVEAQQQVRPAARRVIQDQMKLVDHLNEQVQALEEQIDQVITLAPRQAEDFRLLDSLPGVGRVTALMMLAEIGDIRRFNSPKALCNWAGLTPTVKQSDLIVRHGRISKQGSAHLRGAMTRAASVAARTSPRWYRVHEKLVKRCGRTGAKVAVARRLLTVAFHLLKKREPYREDYISNAQKNAGEPAALHGS